MHVQCHLHLPDGRQAVVRNGYLPERTIQTGIGDVNIRVPKVGCDRSCSVSSSPTPCCLPISSVSAAQRLWCHGSALKASPAGIIRTNPVGCRVTRPRGSRPTPPAGLRKVGVTNTGNGQVDVPKVKEALHDIWVDEIRDNAYKAFDRPLTRFQAKYPGVMEKLVKDRDELLAFHDFPAEHWGRIRAINSMESTFSTARLRIRRTRNCGAREPTLI
ncbi:hypothetical protein DBV23_02815 [Edwardsiella ictaluri]|nr:hypothetical protein DBV23_02815 [Edwardsiella ictaluri]